MLAPPIAGIIPPWDGSLDVMFLLDCSQAIGFKMCLSIQRLVQDTLRRFAFQDEGRVCCGFLQFESELSVEQTPSADLDSVMSNLRDFDLLGITR